MEEQNTIIHNILKNSNLNQSINETTSGDIESVLDMVSKTVVDKYNTSLGYSICEVLPTSSPLSVIFASTRDSDGNFKVMKKDIHSNNNIIDTGFTTEVLQDMSKMLKTSTNKSASSVLSGISAQNENLNLMTFIDSNSVTETTLNVDPSVPGWTTAIITQKVSELAIKMNRNSFKTLKSFCILSAKWASYFLSSVYLKDEKKRGTLYIGTYGNTDYYVNPFPNTASEFRQEQFDYSFSIEDPNAIDYCYVGLKSEVPGESSLVFSPYQYSWDFITDPTTGNEKLFLHNRYGIETSPLHEPLRERSLLYKFPITSI